MNPAATLAAAERNVFRHLPKSPPSSGAGNVESPASPTELWWKRPFVLWVLFGGLVYGGVSLILLMVEGGFFDVTVTVFAALFIVTGVVSLLGNRWGILGGTILAILFVALFAPFIAPVLLNPANPSYWLAITGIPLLLLVVIFGILSLVAWKKGIAQTPYLASPRSGGGLLTLAFVGFVVGGLLAGALASPLIANLVDAGGAGATIRIVHSAALMTTQEPFSPGSWTVPVNGTVTWYNGDTMQHTVTSDTGTRVAFDSGFLESGATFSFKFTVPGNYTYHCTPHPWMRGTIIVL